MKNLKVFRAILGISMATAIQLAHAAPAEKQNFADLVKKFKSQDDKLDFYDPDLTKAKGLDCKVTYPDGYTMTEYGEISFAADTAAFVVTGQNSSGGKYNGASYVMQTSRPAKVILENSIFVKEEVFITAKGRLVNTVPYSNYKATAIDFLTTHILTSKAGVQIVVSCFFSSGSFFTDLV